MKMLINGAWTDAADGSTIQVLNSATQKPIDTVPQATEADVLKAFEAAQAVEISNATKYGLQGGVMTRSMERAMRVAAGLHCGGVVINASGNYRHLEQAFGGWKMSGQGREGVSVTLDEMTQEKTYILKNIL